MEFDARSIVQIIKACADAQVTNFKLNALEIAFSKKADTIEPVQQEVVGTGFNEVTFSAPLVEDDLLISDPLAYENRALGDDENDQD